MVRQAHQPWFDKLTNQMRIYSYIIDWPSVRCDADTIRRELAPCVDNTTVVRIKSLDYTEQFREAVSCFMENEFPRSADDVFMLCMSDVSCGSWRDLVEGARRIFSNPDTGLAEPHIINTAWESSFVDLRDMGGRVTEIAQCDGIVLFVKRPVLVNSLLPSPGLNPHGWGIDMVLCETARTLGLLCVRDYSVTVYHRKGTGYDFTDAKKGMRDYLNSLSDEYRHLKRRYL